MVLVSTRKAEKFFKAKTEFTTGPMELQHMMEDEENINIIDVRTADDFAKGHIPGAISLPRDEWLTCKGLTKDRNNVIYCYSEVCHLAAEAAKEFASEGFPVIELEGGFEEWQKYNLPIVP
ncbi:MAG: rhodanese-like domain-containing protein [Planctomycetes bacterium]|nr:rhodanese-like domain-containing protein [Planctomycetota bacterium]